MKKKVFVFDLDDTLYKEIDFLKSAYREIADWLSASFHVSDAYDYMLSCYQRGENVFLNTNEKYNLQIELSEYLTRYRGHVPHISLLEEVRQVLYQLKIENDVLGIITDGREITQSNKIAALGLEEYIQRENCIISECFGYSKPALEAYLFFQNKYPDCIYYYIGDNMEKDFIAPNKLGWTTVCLLDNGMNIHKQRKVDVQKSPLYFISSLKELLVL